MVAVVCYMSVHRTGFGGPDNPPIKSQRHKHTQHTGHEVGGLGGRLRVGAEEAEGELVGAEEEGVKGDVPRELRAQPDEEPAGAL